MSLLSWGGQQQILVNEDLNKATVEPQLQIKRGSFDVPLHCNEGSFPLATACSTPVCTQGGNGHFFVLALPQLCDYSRGSGPNPLLHYVSMGNKWLKSMTVAAQQLIFQDVRQYVCNINAQTRLSPQCCFAQTFMKKSQYSVKAALTAFKICCFRAPLRCLSFPTFV